LLSLSEGHLLQISSASEEIVTPSRRAASSTASRFSTKSLSYPSPPKNWRQIRWCPRNEAILPIMPSGPAIRYNRDVLGKDLPNSTRA
jgi:hypothetical protein